MLSILAGVHRGMTAGAVCIALLATVACAHGAEFSERFYAFDNGTGRDQKLPFTEQADLLARTGFAGMGIYTGTARIPELLAALDARKLRLVSIYVHSYVDGRAEAIDPGIPAAIRDLSGRDTLLLLTIQGRGPDAEERAVENVRRVADLAAKHGLRVCIYPHINFYVETTADALRVVEKAGRPNVGVALNLYHTVAFHLSRCGSDDFDTARLLRDALPRLFLVSINGITRQGRTAILERLDRGDYDVGRFLSLLHEGGYTGPVALQSYGVKGELEENLSRSISAWRRMTGAAAVLADKPVPVINAPKVIKKTEPQYTDQAKAASVEGTVTLDAELNENGRLSAFKIFKGLGYGLDEKAIECAREWQFEPATRNGAPFTARVKVDVNFRLPPEPSGRDREKER
jgi:TonB family protein